MIREFIKQKVKEGCAAHDLFGIKIRGAVDDFIFNHGPQVDRYNRYYYNYNHDREMEHEKRLKIWRM